MLSLKIEDLLLGTKYRSGSRNLEGRIIDVVRVDYTDTYKVEVYGDEYPHANFWATLQVVTD